MSSDFGAPCRRGIFIKAKYEEEKISNAELEKSLKNLVFVNFSKFPRGLDNSKLCVFRHKIFEVD